MRADSGLSAYTLVTQQNRIQLREDASNHPLPNQFRLDYFKSAPALIPLQFGEGDWEGEYMHFNVTVPDSLGKSFLCRDYLFVAMECLWVERKNIKTLSYEGQRVVQEASRLVTSIRRMVERGSKVAFVHSQEGEEMQQFALVILAVSPLER